MANDASGNGARTEFSSRTRALSSKLRSYCTEDPGIRGFYPDQKIIEGFHDLLKGMPENRNWKEGCETLKSLDHDLLCQVVNFLNARKHDLSQQVDRLFGLVQSFPQWKGYAVQARRAIEPFVKRIRESQGKDRFRLNVVAAASEYNSALIAVEAARSEIERLRDTRGPQILDQQARAEIEEEFREIIADLETGFGTLEDESVGAAA